MESKPMHEQVNLPTMSDLVYRKIDQLPLLSISFLYFCFKPYDFTENKSIRKVKACFGLLFKGDAHKTFEYN